MSNKELAIRIYGIDRDGTFFDLSEEYDLDSFHGALPAVGDRIVDPGVQVGLDRGIAQNRTVWVVKHRYFHVATSPNETWRYVVLVCKVRKGEPFEQNIVSKS